MTNSRAGLPDLSREPAAKATPPVRGGQLPTERKDLTMTLPDPKIVAELAATLLSHRDTIEPHHVRKAVETARMIVCESCAEAPGSDGATLSATEAPDVAAISGTRVIAA